MNLIDKLKFLDEYRNKFIQLANKYVESSYVRAVDPELYTWLTLNAPKAQREVGIFGIGEYIAPFQIYKIRNYQFIVNTLPKFREHFLNNAEITSVDDILLRCIGYYQEIDDRVIKEGKNPFKWFQYGVRFLVGLPFMILKWFGIISDQTLDNITSNRFFKVLSGLVGLIGFFGSIVTIITGWEAFKNIILSFLY